MAGTDAYTPCILLIWRSLAGWPPSAHLAWAMHLWAVSKRVSSGCDIDEVGHEKHTIEDTYRIWSPHILIVWERHSAGAVA